MKSIDRTEVFRETDLFASSQDGVDVNSLFETRLYPGFRERDNIKVVTLIYIIHECCDVIDDLIEFFNIFQNTDVEHKLGVIL